MIHLKPQLIVTILVTSTLLQSCTIEKRTLLSGYHIEWVSEVNNNTNVRTAEEQQHIALILPKESTGLSLGQRTLLFVNHPELENRFASCSPANQSKQAQVPEENVQKHFSQEKNIVFNSNITKRMVSGTIEGNSNVAVIDSTKQNEILYPNKPENSSWEKAQNTADWMALFALLTCWTVIGVPLFLILRRRQIDKMINLKRQEGMTVADKKAWYNTNVFWLSILVFPLFPFALTLRLIDKKRISKGQSPLKWQSKTIFFILSFVAIMLITIARDGLLSLPTMTFSI
jgi:hypothetical protein